MPTPQLPSGTAAMALRLRLPSCGPAWSDLRRAAQGGKSLTPVKWIPQSRGLNINITLLFAVSARAMLAELEGSGVSLKEVTDQLVKDGVQQFADAFDKLFSAVARHRTLPDGDRARLTIGPGSPPRRSRSIDPNRLIPARQRAASQPSCPRRSLTEIAIRFKQAPYTAFQDTAVNTLRPNWLVLSIAPDGGISLQFEVKRRGPVVDLAAVKMDFHYDDWFPKEPNAGYETLIYDVMIGDPMLFMRADIVEQSWRIVQPVLDARAAEKADFTDYDSSSDGPKAADELLARAGGRAWEPVLHALERKQ
jgi:hypothetical protein